MSLESQPSDKPFRSSAHLRPLALVCVLGAAFALRVVFAQFYPPERTWADATAYHGVAINLIAGDGYSLDGREPTRIRPPSYPVYLACIYALAGPHPGRAALVQAALGCLTCLLAYRIGRRVFSERAGLLAAAITAAYPALVYYDTRILRAGFSAFLFTLAVWLALVIERRYSPPRGFLLGIMIGVLSLCRPELIIPASAASILFLWPFKPFKQAISRGLLIVLSVLLLWIPWTARNYATFGTLSPVTAGLGSVLWFGSRWAEIGGDDHSPEDRAQLQAQTREMRPIVESEIDGRFLEDAVKDILTKPAWFARMVGRKMVMFWRDANGVKKTLPRIHPALSPLLNLYYYGLLLLAICATALNWRRDSRTRLLFGVVFIYMMTYALLHVRNRYRVPVLPVVFVLSAGGFWMLIDLARQALTERAVDSPNQV